MEIAGDRPPRYGNIETRGLSYRKKSRPGGLSYRKNESCGVARNHFDNNEL